MLILSLQKGLMKEQGEGVVFIACMFHRRVGIIWGGDVGVNCKIVIRKLCTEEKPKLAREGA